MILGFGMAILCIFYNDTICSMQKSPRVLKKYAQSLVNEGVAVPEKPQGHVKEKGEEKRAVEQEFREWKKELCSVCNNHDVALCEKLLNASPKKLTSKEISALQSNLKTKKNEAWFLLATATGSCFAMPLSLMVVLTAADDSVRVKAIATFFASAGACIGTGIGASNAFDKSEKERPIFALFEKKIETLKQLEESEKQSKRD